MKKYLLIAGFILISFCFFYYTRNPLNTRVVVHTTPEQSESSQVKINEVVFTVDLAVTKEEKYKGLGGRESMEELHGMLFVNDHEERYGFVMRDMKFPLDFLWIRKNVIVDITENVQVDKTLPMASYQPAVPVDTILEVNAGTVEKYGIEIGDIIEILN